MTEEDRISRRASLKGIAATGALIGGSVLGVNSASAGDKQKQDGHKKDKKHKDGHKKHKKDHYNGPDVEEIEGQVAFNFECANPYQDKAKFYLHHGADTDLTFAYHVAETDTKGKITVRDSLATAETFWVPAPDGQATVTLFYNGTPVGKATSDPTALCEEVDG